VGLIYRSATAEVLATQTLFTDDSWAFPRPPLEALVEVSTGEGVVSFSVIVLHLKAFGDFVDRRRAACARARRVPRWAHGGPLPPARRLNDDPHDPAEVNSFAGTFLGRRARVTPSSRPSSPRSR